MSSHGVVVAVFAGLVRQFGGFVDKGWHHGERVKQNGRKVPAVRSVFRLRENLDIPGSRVHGVAEGLLHRCRHHFFPAETAGRIPDQKHNLDLTSCLSSKDYEANPVEHMVHNVRHVVEPPIYRTPLLTFVGR